LDKASQHQKAAKSANDHSKFCENIDVSKGLYVAADTIRWATRYMEALAREALTREAQMETWRKIETKRRMWQKREGISREKLVRKEGGGGEGLYDKWGRKESGEWKTENQWYGNGEGDA
jgi:hypothetical protein